MSSTGYIFSSSELEDNRLRLQSMGLEPLTRRALQASGARPGASVLDLATGAGDVALLASEMVGDSGRVVAVDRDPAVLERTRARLREAGRSTVELVECDVADVARLGTFDVVIGRLILFHNPDPVALIRAAAACLAEGGTVAFQEPVLLRDQKSCPPVSAWDEGWSLCLEAFEAAGMTTDIGLRLAGLFATAGLSPELACETAMWAPSDPVSAEWLTATMASLAPVMDARGILRADDLDLDRRKAAIRDGAQRLDSQLIGFPTVAAWATKPPAR